MPRIDIWSDFACPWCAIGEKRLERALLDLGASKQFAIMPRAFELDPYAPAVPRFDAVGRLADKYGMSPEKAREKILQIEKAAREENLDFKYLGAQYTNTFDAHRLMKLAESKNDQGLISRINWTLFEAYFTLNLRLADSDTLLAAGCKAGLEENEIKDMLASQRFVEETRADELEAAARRVRSVPFFVFENGPVIPGAVPYADFVKAIQMSLGVTGIKTGRGAACGPDGCEL